MILTTTKRRGRKFNPMEWLDVMLGAVDYNASGYWR